MKYELIVENMMSYFTSPDYESEAVRARVQFHKAAGIFDEESVDFEMKLAQFTDWYLFTRNLGETGKPPIQWVLESDDYQVNEEERALYMNLSNNRHSLFEFTRLKGQDVHVKDLFSGYRMVIKGSKVTIGFEKGQIFEARLFPHEDNFVFASAFCFHPHEATKYVLKEVKTVNKIKDEEERDKARIALMDKIFRMRYQHEHYRHVDIRDIYTNNSKLR